jgi:RecA/RadA recombinase
MGDAELLEKMFNAVNGEAIRRLYNGDPSGYPSKSEADFALCSHLAFWTRNDPEQMDSMLQASGLYRDKLKRKDYRKRTIDNVIKGGGNTYQSAPKHGTEIDLTPPSVDAPVIPVYTRKQFNDLPPLEWLVEGLFAEKDYVMVYGPSGAGKTFVMLDLAAACVAGEPVAGIFPVKRPMSVWYCSREGVGGMGARLNSACEKYNLPDDAALYYTPITPQLFKNEVTNPQAAKWFIKRWQEMGSGPLDLLIIDTYWTATDGMDENSASDARVVARTLDDIKCELGCVVMLSHHANKGGMIERGSGALRAIMDCIMRVDATDSTHTLACEKQKEGREWEPLDFTLQTDIEDLSGCTVQWGAQSKAPTPGTQAQILELLQSDLKLWGPAAISTKLKTVGTRQNVSDQLVKLAKDNKVVCEGKPAKYRAVQ